MGKGRRHTAEFKAQVVLEILSGAKSLAQASREYQVKESLLYRWKSAFVERAPQVFAVEGEAKERSQEQRVAALERLVGRLTLELEVAKKALPLLRPSPPSGGRSRDS